MLFWLLLFVALHIEANPSFDTRVFEGSQALTENPHSKHFVIIITSFNNQQWYVDNIRSACSQKYDDFEIIFVDDCSRDKTGTLVESFLELNPPCCKVTIIKNHQRVGALQNIYRAISWCKPSDIVVSLDGDDWLANPHVLSKLNTVYADENVWMTHGQLQMYPSGEICYWSEPMPAHIIAKNAYRKYPRTPTHLRTFYVWLFRQIKVEDLLYEGRFYPMTWDMAFMIPMMELSGGKHAFIPDVLYIYNEHNPINDHKVNKALQRQLDLHIRTKAPYRPIKHRILKSSTGDVPVTTFIVSHDNADELSRFIKSLQKYVSPLGHIFVVWKANTVESEAAYQTLIRLFPHIDFIPHNAIHSMRELYANIAHRNAYVLISNARMPYTRHIELQTCIQTLKNTHADGFYFVNNIPDTNFRCIDVDGEIKAWQLSYTPEEWRQTNPCIAMLYKNSAMVDFLLNCITQDEIPFCLSVKSHTVGLFLKS